MFTFLIKGRSHKYIKKIPTGKKTKTGKPRWKYIYPSDLGASRAQHVESKGLKRYVAAMPATLNVKDLAVGTVLTIGHKGHHIKIVAKAHGGFVLEHDHKGHPDHGKRALMSGEQVKDLYEKVAAIENWKFIQRKLSSLEKLITDRWDQGNPLTRREMGRVKAALTRLSKTEAFQKAPPLTKDKLALVRELAEVAVAQKPKKAKPVAKPKKVKVKKVEVTSKPSVELSKSTKKALSGLNAYVKRTASVYHNDEMQFEIPPPPTFSPEQIRLQRSLALFTAASVATCRNPEDFNEAKSQPRVRGPYVTLIDKKTGAVNKARTTYFGGKQSTLATMGGSSVFDSSKRAVPVPEGSPPKFSKKDYQDANKDLKDLARAPLSGVDVIYRGMSIALDDFEAMKKAVKKGDSYALNLYDFTSFSKNRSIAMNFAKRADKEKDGVPHKRAMFVIENPTRGTDIEPYSGFQGENEVLTGGHMKVTRREYKNGIHIFYGTHADLTPEELNR